MNNLMTELQAALQAAGHGAEEVQNSPVDMLNVWVNDEGRQPTMTVMYDAVAPDQEGRLVWGHHWEHSIAGSVGMDAVVAAIVGTSNDQRARE